VPGSSSLDYSAAVWLSVTQGAAGWGALPWCAGEPNNKGRNEGCASLLTACATPGSAAANDMPCSELLRVMCAVPGDCSGGGCCVLGFACWWLAGWGNCSCRPTLLGGLGSCSEHLRSLPCMQRLPGFCQHQFKPSTAQQSVLLSPAALAALAAGSPAGGSGPSPSSGCSEVGVQSRCPGCVRHALLAAAF
jgi:hypothetical protein